MRKYTQILALVVLTSLAANVSKATSFILADFTYTVNDISNVAIATSSVGELQFGFFATGFTPTAGNFSQWAANFTGVTGYYDGSSPEWSAGINLGDGGNLLYPVNTQLVAIVYNILDNAPASTATQAAIVTNTAWKITAVSGSDPTQFYFDFTGKYAPTPVSLASTTAILGSINNESSIVTMDLVPEPSTASLMMLGAAGLVALRRLRKV